MVDLPDGLILTKDSPAIITITNQNGEPQKDVSVIVIADKDYIEKGLTDRYGKLTVPPVNSGYTDKDGKVNVNGFNVIVNDETKQIENAFVTLNDDNTISVLLPTENLIDYSNRICVTVLDKDGAAVKDMTVKVIDVTENNRSGVTDENGKMVVPPLSEDKTDKDGKATVNGLNILVTDEKAVIENAFVTITDGKINIELPADKVIDISNRIIVTVTDSENKAVKDMSVTVKDNTERTETNLTDADGKAVIPPTTFDITDVNGYGELTGFEIVVTDESKVIENASLTLNEDNSISVVLPAETLIAHSNRITVIVTNKADKTPAKDISVTVCEAPKTETEETAKSVSGKTDADGKIVVPPLSEDITDNEGNSGVTDKEEKPGEDTDGDGKEDKPGETVTTLYKVALNDTKYFFKACVAVLIVSNTFNLIMAVFDVGQHIVSNSAGVIAGNTNINISSALTNLRPTLEAMGTGELFLLMLETALVSLCMKILSVCITVVIFGRMIEIYLYSSVGAIPFATMANREWGQVGSNYLRGLVALAFQGFFIMVCVGIYAALVNSFTATSDIHSTIFSIAAYTVVLCFTLFKTGSISKSIFNAH